MHVLDTYGRPLANLRISVTDRCNLRCVYCMPEEEYRWLPRADLLSFEEIGRLVGAFCSLGVERLRLTGGEPLLRRDLHRLVALLACEEELRDVALTTNGLRLAEQAQELHDAGLHRVTVSLDTLRPERFEQLTRRSGLERVIEGVHAATRAGFTGTKIDTVVLRGTNDDELSDMIEFGRGAGAEVRFIEYMDVGGATRWTMDAVVPRAEMLERLSREYGPIQPIAESTSATADRYLLPDGTTFGIIASTTAPFCSTCDRSRLTADGMWYQCLYARDGLDLREPLRAGASSAELARAIAGQWQVRDDRGAEQRLAEHDRGRAFEPPELENDPHLEMHTRGG